MDVIAASTNKRTGADRRLLPRAENGMRASDIAERELISEEAVPPAERSESGMKYVLLVAMLFLIGLYGVFSASKYLAPVLNDDQKIEKVGKVLASGQNYLTYDLNIETRLLKHSLIEGLPQTPELAVLGASHWQEAPASLAGDVQMFNAHVHRDYFEDILGVTNMFVRVGKLPKKMIITIRDNQFKPFHKRTDWLWVPIMKDYQEMAARLNLPIMNYYPNGLTPQVRQKLSLPLLKANVERYLAAPVAPGPSDLNVHPTLDTLHADGSITWSTLHQQAFTPERAKAEALAHAYAQRPYAPGIDPIGRQSVDAVFAFLKEQGVEVYLAHPPFNPIYWEAVQGSPYMDGIEDIRQMTREWSEKYDMPIIGGFDPAKTGCTADMYIDGEHSNSVCLGKIITQFLELDKARQVTAGKGS